MLWCKHCKKAIVEPQERVTYDIPNPDAGGFEKIVTYHCPDCGEEVYLQTGYCVMCGEHAEPGKTLCWTCCMEIHETLNELSMQMDLPFVNVLDGVAEYLNMEE